jgi:(2Fe-2S) ferredoxin
MVVVYPEDVWYGQVSPEAARRILDEHLVAGVPVEDLIYRAKPGANKDPQRMAAIEKMKAGSGPAAT